MQYAVWQFAVAVVTSDSTFKRRIIGNHSYSKLTTPNTKLQGAAVVTSDSTSKRSIYGDHIYSQLITRHSRLQGKNENNRSLARGLAPSLDFGS